MGNRLTRIYTRTGDDGTTGLGDGSRVAKDAARIEAIGSVDELNCVLGLLLCEELPASIRECLTDVQHRLFDTGGELSIPGYTAIDEQHVSELENNLDAFNADLPALKEFILPGGARSAALAHVARATCRRAERRVLVIAPPVCNREVVRLLNRASDLLWLLARRAEEPAE